MDILGCHYASYYSLCYYYLQFYAEKNEVREADSSSEALQLPSPEWAQI